MAISRNSIDDFLESSGIILENSQAVPEVRAELAKYGYDEARFQAGMIMYQEMIALQALQKKEFGEQVARLAFKDNPDTGRELLLYGDRKTSFSGWG